MGRMWNYVVINQKCNCKNYCEINCQIYQKLQNKVLE